MQREFKEIVKVLREAKRRKFILDFALTGALALSAFSRPRATKDMDFIVTMEKGRIPFFMDWLMYAKEYKHTKRHIGRPKDSIKDLIEVRIGGTWAVLIVAAHEFEKDAVAAAVPVSAYGKVRLKVVRPEHLVILKLRAGSDQDYVDCAHIWNEKIDKGFVRKTVKALFMESRLKKVISIAKRAQRPIPNM